MQFFFVQDVTTPNAVLPTYAGVIFAKVIRLDNDASLRRRIRLQRKKDSFWGGNGATASAPQPQPQSQQQQQSQSQVKQPVRPDSTASAEVKTANPKTASSKPAASEVDLLDASDYNAQSSVRMVASAVDMLDLSGGMSAKATPLPRSVSDPGGTSSSSSIAGIEIDDDAQPLRREELAARREAGVQEKVKSALEFKQELDENQRKASNELEDARTKHDKNLTAWATNNNEKKNVRNLLTSMHTVLWPDSGWKPVGLGDVIESKKVKLFYRKAMLVVHPDRCSSQTAEIRFIAKRIFEAINEAYQEFLKKEGVE